MCLRNPTLTWVHLTGFLMSQKRILMNLKTSDLEQLFLVAVKNSDTEQLMQLQQELTHRTRKNAILLLGKVSEVLDRTSAVSKPQSQLEKIKEGMTKKSFGGTLRAWRTYAGRLAKQPELENEIVEIWRTIYQIWEGETDDYFNFTKDEIKELEIDNSPLSGILSYFGYRTKVTKIVRRQILEELIHATIPPVVNYHEWGEPDTFARLEKIRLTLSGLPFPHRSQKVFEGAVKIWDEDHKWFMKNLYCEH